MYANRPPYRGPRFTPDQIKLIFSDDISDGTSNYAKKAILNQASDEKLALKLAINFLSQLKRDKGKKEIGIFIRGSDELLKEKTYAVLLWFKHISCDKKGSVVGCNILNAVLPESIHDLSHLEIYVQGGRYPERSNFFNRKKSREIDYIRMIMPILYSETSTLLADIWRQMLDSLEPSLKPSASETNEVEVLFDGRAAKSSGSAVVEQLTSITKLNISPIKPINVPAIQESQRDVFEHTKQRLADLMKQHEAILTSRLDANLQDYLRLQQNILAEHNASTQQGIKILVEKIVMAHGTVGINTAGFQQDVLAALTELANIKYQLEMQCNKTLTQEQILNKLNVAFGDEAEQRICFQSFKEELKANPSWTVFFIEFVIGFSSKIESARLLQSGYFDLAASHAEQGVGVIGNLASGLPGIGGLASIGAQGTAMVINMYRQREIAKGTKHLDILTTDISCLSQELGCFIIRHYHKVIDSVYKVNKVSTVGKLSLGLFNATDEEVRLKMGQKLVREAAKKAVDCLVEYLQSSEFTSGPIVNQLLTVIECHIEKIFGSQHLVSNTSDRNPEAATSPASSRQALYNANELRELKTQVELLKIQGKFREQRNNSNMNGNPASQGFNFGGGV